MCKLAMLIAFIEFYHFIPLSFTLMVAGGSQGQHKAKPVGLIFFSTDLGEICGVEAIQTECPATTFG